jgi:hypothetical protein
MILTIRRMKGDYILKRLFERKNKYTENHAAHQKCGLQ